MDRQKYHETLNSSLTEFFVCQVTPDSFVLVAGALTEVLLSFRPVAVGSKDMKVNLVDSETRELVYALIVSAEATGPLITRCDLFL